MAGKPVAIIMGSQSDWATMQHAADTLAALGIGCEALIVSAHRTPDRLYKFAKGARRKGFKVIIAGAGGAAHLPGMTAALTSLPVLGVPMTTHALEGKDSLLSIMQMPAGIPPCSPSPTRDSPSASINGARARPQRSASARRISVTPVARTGA
jgi:5-(carboxyamino)imidazole ribonucleotide mutase